jgi:hypothetical protein
MKLGLPILLAALLLAAATPATARRLQSLHRRQLAEGLDTCTGCLTQEPSKPLPLASDPLSAAAADLSFLVDPITVRKLGPNRPNRQPPTTSNAVPA